MFLLLPPPENMKLLRSTVATAFDDQKLIAKLEVDKTAFTICDFVAKEIRYHANAEQNFKTEPT